MAVAEEVEVVVVEERVVVEEAVVEEEVALMDLRELRVRREHPDGMVNQVLLAIPVHQPHLDSKEAVLVLLPLLVSLLFQAPPLLLVAPMLPLLLPVPLDGTAAMGAMGAMVDMVVM